MGSINLLGSDLWSEADIMAHGREVINAQVSTPRQDELRTIMLGHIAGMRVATPDELAEIALVQQITEAQSAANAQARADMELLTETLNYEEAVERLSYPKVTEPLTVMKNEVEVPNPMIAEDAEDCRIAQAAVDAATPEVLALYALRHPPEVVEVVSA